MISNKEIVTKYRDSFSRGDRNSVATWLSEDVEWTEWVNGTPESGVAHRGKVAFIDNISDPPGGWPLRMETTRMTEENDVVVVEGKLRVPLEDGGVFNVQSCSIFELRNGKIVRLTSWAAEAKDAQ